MNLSDSERRLRSPQNPKHGGLNRALRWSHRPTASKVMLGQRLDRYQRLQVLRKLPVVGQLVVVHPRPFANET